MPAADAKPRAGHAPPTVVPSTPLIDANPLTCLKPGARRRVAVAVSGGGDSMALLALARAWSGSRAERPEIVALTVDHGLRAGSAAEAAEVARFCARHGIAHRVLTWQGDKPASGLQEAARRARHDLLAGAAGELGTDLVLTAHTLDDQAETIAMRAARGGGRGLAGMAPATLVNGAVWFARPLLGTLREALRHYLTAHDVGWVDDPSNEDMRFERVRTRKNLSEDDRERLVRVGVGAAARRRALGRRAARIIATHASSPAEGLIVLDPAFASDDREAALHALRILLALAGGRTHPVDETRAAALLARLSGPGASSGTWRAVLSHALVERRADAIHLHREARDLPTVALEGTAPFVWDGRYRLTRAGARRGILGPAAAGAEVAAAPPAGVPARVFRGASAALPVFTGDGTVPLVGARAIAAQGLGCEPVPAPWATHLPAFDLALARAATKLIGAAPLPDPPLVEHIAP